MFSKRGVIVLSQSRALSFRLLSSTAVTSHSVEGAPVQSEQQQTKATHPRILIIEGYQGSLNPISLKSAKSLLSRAIKQAKESPSFQGIQGSGDQFQTSHRSFHTSSNRPLVQKTEASLDGDSENSTQGIQGDGCINFKLWMESCRRYGLENCDQQLQGIQTGRKTLAQVLAEQDELIHSISEKYRQEAYAAHRQGESSIQGLQEGVNMFPSVNAPCPQGVQGEDCIRFKLWLENCHRFGFSECMNQLESMSSGRKSLGQVFAEQDQVIRSVVDRYQQKRGYSTSASDHKSDPQVGGSSDTKLTQREQLKRTVKEYGASAIVFHIGISLISLGGFYLAVSSGFDVIGILKSLGVGERILESKAVSGAGTFVVAYAVYKVFAPVRIAITVTSTPFIVRHLRRIGFLKPPKPKVVTK